MKESLRRIDALLYRTERVLAGALFLCMALVMFASVTHRVFSREEGRLAGMLAALAGADVDQATLDGPATLALNLLLTFAFSYAALRTMQRSKALSTGQALGLALVATVVLAGIVKLLLVTLPNGLVWGSVVALTCMLWVGFLGASIATYEKRHLALEMGEKIWPERSMPYVRSAAMVAAALFCTFLVALSVISISDHFASWDVNPLAGNLLPTQIPKWAVFLIFPYTFVVMTLRFAGFASGALRGESVFEEKIG